MKGFQYVVVTLLAAGLAGCDSDKEYADLQAFMDEVRSSPKVIAPTASRACSAVALDKSVAN